MASLAEYYQGLVGAGALDSRDRDQLVMQGEPLRYSQADMQFMDDRTIRENRERGATAIIPREGGGYSTIRPDANVLPGGDRLISSGEAAARYAQSQAGGRPLADPYGVAAGAYRQQQSAAEMQAYKLADYLAPFLPPERIVSEVQRHTGVDLSGKLASTPNLLKRSQDEVGIAKTRADTEDTRAQTAGRRQEQAAKAYEGDVVAPALAAQRLDSVMTDLGAIQEQATRLHSDPNLATAVGPIQGRLPSFTKGAASFDAGLESLKSQISQMALQQMRDASKTGGAVGNVTVEEWKKLADTVASLSSAQGEASLRASLTAVAKRAAQLQARAAESNAAQFGDKQLPVAARQQVPDGKFRVFENGQVWTRENGVLKRVR